MHHLATAALPARHAPPLTGTLPIAATLAHLNRMRDAMRADEKARRECVRKKREDHGKYVWIAKADKTPLPSFSDAWTTVTARPGEPLMLDGVDAAFSLAVRVRAVPLRGWLAAVAKDRRRGFGLAVVVEPSTRCGVHALSLTATDRKGNRTVLTIGEPAT